MGNCFSRNRTFIRLRLQLQAASHTIKKKQNKVVTKLSNALKCPCFLMCIIKIYEMNMMQYYEKCKEGLASFFELIGFAEEDVWSFYQTFCMIDVDNSLSIDIDEFFDFFELRESAHTDFMKRAFHTFDLDEEGETGNKELDFGEFVACLWNYCTFTHGQLVEFTFDLYDQEGLEAIDIRLLAEQIYGRHKVDDDLIALVTEYDLDGSGTIDMEEFRQFEKEHRLILQPAFELSRKLKRKLETPFFWIDQTMRRHSKLGPTGINMMDTFRKVRAGEEFDSLPGGVPLHIAVVTSPDQSVTGCSSDWINPLPPALQWMPLGDVLKCKECGLSRHEHPGCPPHVYTEPRTGSEIAESAPVLKMDEKVKVYEQRLDTEHSGTIWYLIDPTEQWWVCQEHLAVDFDWLQDQAFKRAKELRLKRANRAAAAAKNEKEGKIRAVQEQYEELIDLESGRAYWVDKITMEATWDDPYMQLGFEMPTVFERREQKRKDDERLRAEEEALAIKLAIKEAETANVETKSEETKNPEGASAAIAHPEGDEAHPEGDEPHPEGDKEVLVYPETVELVDAEAEVVDAASTNKLKSQESAVTVYPETVVVEEEPVLPFDPEEAKGLEAVHPVDALDPDGLEAVHPEDPDGLEADDDEDESTPLLT